MSTEDTNTTTNDTAPTRVKNHANFIFLDIDGVLNSTKSNIAYGGTPDLNDDLKSKRLVLNPNTIDTSTAGLVNTLAAVTNSYVVMSSSWRHKLTGEQTVKVLSELGIHPSIILGRIPSMFPETNRWGDIQLFLDMMEGIIPLDESLLSPECDKSVIPVPLGKYVILDDTSPFMTEPSEGQASTWVKVNGVEGLSLRNILTAGSVLTENPKFFISDIRGKVKYGLISVKETE